MKELLPRRRRRKMRKRRNKYRIFQKLGTIGKDFPRFMDKVRAASHVAFVGTGHLTLSQRWNSFFSCEMRRDWDL
jgi:hypothetical protein